MTTFDKIRDVIAESADVDPAEITPESTFVLLGIDSLDQVQLIIDLEEAFDLEIMDDEAETMFGVKDVMNYVDSRCCPQ